MQMFGKHHPMLLNDHTQHCRIRSCHLPLENDVESVAQSVGGVQSYLQKTNHWIESFNPSPFMVQE
jgi:hypothetical protein